MGKGYLKALEAKTYGLFRNIEVEVFDKEKGRPVREKAGELGPIGIFRECEGDEKPDLRTVDPISTRLLELKKIS